MWLIYSRVDTAYQEQCALDGIAQADCNLLLKMKDDLAASRIGWLVAIIGIYLVSNVSRAYKWMLLLGAMDYKPRFWNCFWTIMIGYFANLGFPRLGEILRPGLLSKHENIPLEKVLGTVIVDRIVDVVFLGLVIGIAFLVGWSDFVALWRSLEINHEQEAASGPDLKLIVLAVAVIGILFLYLTRNYGWSKKIRDRIIQAVQGFKDGLLSALRVKNIPAFIFHSAVIWVCYYLMVVFGFWAFEPSEHLGLVPALFLFILTSLAMIIPTPGGMGSYHYFVMTGLMWYGLDKVQGFSFAMIMFILLHLFGNILFGLIGWVVLPIINDKKQVA